MEDVGVKSLNTNISPLINETLSCIYCKIVKRSSKLLKCNHVICSDCLTSLIVNGSVECCSCNLLTPAPNGASDLDDNFFIQNCINKGEVIANIGVTQCNNCCLGKSTPSELYCIQCDRYMCQADWNAHKNFFPGASLHVCINKFSKDLESESESIQSLILTSSLQLCPQHPTSSVEMYCSDCKTLVCASCIVVTHKNHTVSGISEALRSELEDFSKCRESLDEKIDTCKQTLQQAEQKKGHLEEERELQRSAIERAYQENLAEITRQRDDKLLQLKADYDDVINSLFVHIQQMESTLNQTYQAVRLTQSCNALAQSKEDQLFLIPKVTDRLLFLSETIPKQQPIHSDSCLGASRFPAEAVRGKYSMEPKEPSHHFGDNLNLQKTRGICTGEGNEMFVIDKGNSLIHRFSPEGKQILGFGKYGRGPGEFKNPWGICVYGKRLWITDSSIGIVMSFSLEGTYFSRFGDWGSGPGEFQSPKGISADANGCIWVADCDNNRVQRFEQNGKHLATIPASDKISMKKPVDVTISPDNTVWVLTSSDPAIQHYNCEGALLDQFASLGKGCTLVLPVSIVYEVSTRCLLVADSAANCILVLSENGVTEGKLSLRGVKPYNLHGVSVDRAGRVVCTAKGVHVFTF